MALFKRREKWRQSMALSSNGNIGKIYQTTSMGMA